MDKTEEIVEKPLEVNKAQVLKGFIITLLFLIILVVFISKDMSHVREFIRNSGWIGLGASLVIYALLGASPIPSEPLTIFIASVFGPLTATLIAGFGNFFAAMVEYYIGFRIGDITSFVERKEKLPLGLGKMPVDSPVFLIVGRQIPGYGNKFVSLAAGVYHVSLFTYIWTTLLTTLVGAAVFAYGGLEVIRLLFHDLRLSHLARSIETLFSSIKSLFNQ
jgi:uncharacterized membrane protein YdjX (TVP38/TMEM64 family)